MRNRRRVARLGLGLTLLGAAPLSAQDSLARPGRAPRDTSLDRVIAVVGARPVLASQVDEEIFMRETQGKRLPTDSASRRLLRQQIVNEIIDEELLVQQAERDTTIKVADKDINDGVEEQMWQVRAGFRNETDYRAELKKTGFQTPEEYRRWLADRQRRAALQNMLVEKLRAEKKIKPAVATDQEIHEYFDAHKATLPKRPATISFRQIVITPQALPEAKARARQLADSLAGELRRGADFAVVARRFSGDPGSRDKGGELEWFRRGQMVPEFERVAFALKPGTISPPVESQFGYHIIQVQRVQPTEVKARHVLIVPEIDSARIDSARILADSLSRLIRAGWPFDSLQRRYHDRSLEREAMDFSVERLTADPKFAPYAKAIGTADSGTVVPVFQLSDGQRPQFVVLQVIGRRPEGDVVFEDVRDQIVDRLSQELSIRRYLDRLRQATYIDIRL